MEWSDNDMALRRLLILGVFCLPMFSQSAGIVNTTVSPSAPAFTATAGITNFDMTLTQNVTATFSSAAPGIVSFKLCQDGTGARTFAWPSNFFGFGSVDPAANKCSRFLGKYDGTNVQALSSCLTDGSGLGGVCNVAMWGTGSQPVAASALGTSGNCAIWTSAGLGDAGSPCGSGAGANALGYYLVNRSTNAPANAINLGALTNGLMKLTISAGVATPSTAAAGTDYQAPIPTGDLNLSTNVLASIGGHAVTLGGAFTTTGAFNATFAIPSTGSWTFPAPGTLVNTSITNLSNLTTVAGGTFGTAAFVATGTSGGVLGLLNGNLTFSGANAYGMPVSITLTNALGLPVGGLAAIAADRIVGNFTASSAIPSTQAIPACVADGAHALTYPSHTLTCTPLTGGSSGFLSQLLDFSTSISGGTLTVNTGASSSVAVPDSFGQTNYSQTAPSTITGTGTGTVYGYVTSSSGQFSIGYDGVSVTSISCTGGCVAVPSITGFPVGSLTHAKFTCTLTSGTWTSCVNFAGTSHSDPVSAGYGMVQVVTAAGTVLSIDTSVVAATFVGTGPPGSGQPGFTTSLPGNTFVDTANHHYYVCNAPLGTAAPACTSVATAQWEQVDGGSGGPATASAINAALNCPESSSSTTAKVCVTPTTFTPSAGQYIIYTSTTSTGSAVTLAVNGASAAPIKKGLGGVAVTTGDIPANQATLMMWDGTNWEALATFGIPCMTPATANQVVVASATGCVNGLITFTGGGYAQFGEPISLGPDTSSLPVAFQSTAGAAGVTIDLGVAADSSNPTKYVTPASGQAFDGISLSTSANGVAMFVAAVPGTVQTGIADTGGVTAGNLLGPGTGVLGNAKDLGTANQLSVACSQQIIGRAKGTTTVGLSFKFAYWGPGIYGGSCAGGSTAWGGIGNPTGNLGLTMGANTSTFTHNAATGSGVNLWTWTDTASNTGTGFMHYVNLASGSAMKPAFFGINGLGFGVINNGSAFVNLNATALPTAQSGTVLQVANANGANTRIESDCYAASCFFSSVRLDGTAASPTTLQSGDQIGGYNGFGHNGTSIVGPVGSFRIFANQNWSVGANGSYVDVTTTPNGSATAAEVIRFENDGGMTTPSVTGGDKGAGTLNAAALYVQGAVVTPNGSRPWWCTSPGLGDGLNAITAATYLQANCYNMTGQTVTLTSIKCFTDNSGSSTCNATNGAGTGLLTGAITATSSFAAGTQSGTTTIASGDFVKITFVADGTTKQFSMAFGGTY